MYTIENNPWETFKNNLSFTAAAIIESTCHYIVKWFNIEKY